MGIEAELRKALKARGFRPDDTVTTHRYYLGSLNAVGHTVSIRLDILDWEFVTRPPITLLDRPGALSRPLPHITEDGELCYLDDRLSVLDPYDPLGMVVSCLKKAEDLLSELICGKDRGDLVREFPAMWFPKDSALIDLPADFSGNAEALAIPGADGKTLLLIAKSAKDVRAFMAASSLNTEKASGPFRVHVHGINAPLVASGDMWPLKSAQNLCRWLCAFDGFAASVIEKDIIPAHQGDTTRIFVIRAPNGVVGGWFQIPKSLDRQEFRTRRTPILAAFRKGGETWPLQRFNCHRVDRSHIYARSLGDGMKTLEGRKILLVGCGAIGGFLAALLTKVGAGSGGRLALADPDILMAENIGRHLLGLPALLHNKADACREFLIHQMGDLEVTAFPGDVRKLQNTLAEYDVIIDATGEEALSLWLNQQRVDAKVEGKKFPPILHVWLHGAGSAAMGFLNVAPEAGCYKCLRPVHGGDWRHDPLLNAPADHGVVLQACGEGTHVLYPISASNHAATLGVEMVLDWARGAPKPLLRSRQIDRHVARASFDRHLEHHEDCPSCRALWSPPSPKALG